MEEDLAPAKLGSKPQDHLRAGAGEEIDILDLLSGIWERRRRIVAVTLVGIVLSLGYVLTRPKVYTSTVFLLPTESPMSGSLSTAEKLLGKRGASGDVDLYQTLLTSRTVMNQLVASKIANASDTGKGKLQTVGEILGIDTGNAIQYALRVRRLSKSILVQPDKSGNSGVVQVSFSASEPWLAQTLADQLVSLGQEEIRKVRSQRFEATISRIAIAVDTALAEWERASAELADFREGNRENLTPSGQRDLSRLQMLEQSRQRSLLMARGEYQDQILQREKAAPPMVVFDKADLPALKGGPRRIVLLAIGTAFFFALGILWAYLDLAVAGWFASRRES